MEKRSLMLHLPQQQSDNDGGKDMRLRNLFVFSFLFLLVFSVSTLNGIAQQVARGELGKKPMVAIVFDDAHHSLLQAFTIMQRCSLIGTAYVPTKLVEQDSFRTSWRIIEEMARVGWEIGAHTATHPNLKALSPDNAWEEIASSKRTLKERGILVRSFAPPFGEMPENLIADTQKIFDNIRMAWGSRDVTNQSLQNDRYALPVFDVAHLARGESLTQLIESATPATFRIIVFHKIGVRENFESTDQYTTQREEFENFISNLCSQKEHGDLHVVTVSDGIQELKE